MSDANNQITSSLNPTPEIAPTSEPLSEPSANSTLSGLHILILEDSRAFAAGLNRILANHTPNVKIFYSGADALEGLKTHKPDIIISDLEMPQMDGFEFVQKVRENTQFSDVPILILTGKEDSETMAQAIQSGADAFAVKSSVNETLIAHILALARLRQVFQSALKGKQFEAVQALIGTYKHEFGNSLTIFSGMLTRLKKNHQEISKDETFGIILSQMAKMIETLRKLDRLRTYEEESYSKKTQILKAS